MCAVYSAQYRSFAGVATHNVKCWQVDEPLGCEDSKEGCCHVADHHWLVLCPLKLHSRDSTQHGFRLAKDSDKVDPTAARACQCGTSDVRADTCAHIWVR